VCAAEVNLSQCDTAQEVSLLAFSEMILDEPRVPPNGEKIFLPRSCFVPYPPKKKN
jgi:hypothetical protein